MMLWDCIITVALLIFVSFSFYVWAVDVYKFFYKRMLRPYSDFHFWRLAFYILLSFLLLFLWHCWLFIEIYSCFD